MEIEKPPKSRKKESTTKLFSIESKQIGKPLYKPFKKKDHEKGVAKAKAAEKKSRKKDKIKEQELLDALGEDDLVKRFADIVEKLHKGSVWTEVEVAKEKHDLAITQLLHKGKEVRFNMLSEEDKNSEEGLSKVSATFSLNKTHGREGYLEFHFTVPILTLLKGGGKIEKKLQKLITEQYAGTTERYKKLKEKSETEMPEESHYLFAGDNSVKLAQRELDKTGKIVVKGDYELVERIIRSQKLQSTPHQISVTSKDGAEWYIEATPINQKGKPIPRLIPQEVVSNATEQK